MSSWHSQITACDHKQMTERCSWAKTFFHAKACVVFLLDCCRFIQSITASIFGGSANTFYVSKPNDDKDKIIG